MDGILLIDKEKGVSSFDVVRKIKKITGVKSVGHTGTLDPLATGLLTILVGKATSLSDYLMGKDKVYVTSIILGIKTTTYDMEGDIVFTSKPDVKIDEIKENIDILTGIEFQKPPIYSAIKINGKKSYELARKNIKVELSERKIKVYSIDILNFNEDVLTLKIHCSKGTYIRSLANDLGEMLGCGACIKELRRIQSGNLFIENSVKISDLTMENIFDYLISPEKVLEEYESIELSKDFHKKLLNGVPVFLNMDDGNYKIYIEGIFWGFGKITNGKLKVIKKFIQENIDGYIK